MDDESDCPCPKLNNPLNGLVNTSEGLGITKVASYACFPGSLLNGSSTRTCLSNSQWSGTTPSCNKIVCPKLNNPINGYIDTSKGFDITKVASYVCFPGYALNGSSTRTCMNNSQWSGTSPSCNIKDCGQLANFPNGSTQQTSTTFLGTILYLCNQGYTLNGNQLRVCQPDGLWSGIRPTCEANCGCCAECTNTIGPFDCICKTGYQSNGFSCIDLDECTTEPSNCDQNAVCNNAPGSFTCACSSGFVGNGVMCEVFNECSNIEPCDADATCFDNGFSHSCACNDGFTGTGLTCTATGGE